jgi:DNA polymerase/3'-5' exonuclease PolX
MSTGRRYPYAEAIAVANSLATVLGPSCLRLEIVGSLRRRRRDVGDIELLYISHTAPRRDPDNMFGLINAPLVDDLLDRLMAQKILAKRRNAIGSEIYGPANKLMVHRQTGIPVDLFAATPDNWWNLLVCRTGPAESNVRLSIRAKSSGWRWHPYGSGFTRGGGPLGGPPEKHGSTSERDVFEFVGLPYLPPEERQ